MLCGESAEGLNDMLLDSCALGLGVVGGVSNDGGCEIGVVDGIVNGDGNLETGVIIDYSTSNTCPHRLDIGGQMRIGMMGRLDQSGGLTVRLV